MGELLGACENEKSLSALSKVIEQPSIQDLPNLTPFKSSKCSDNGGWGNKEALEDEIAYHEAPDFWAQDIYCGPDS